MGHLEGNFTPVLYIGSKFLKVKWYQALAVEEKVQPESGIT
jgi:hypothetical protein